MRPKSNLLFKADELIDIYEHAKERLAVKRAVRKAAKTAAKRTQATAALSHNSSELASVERAKASTAAAEADDDDDDEPVFITVKNYDTGLTERVAIDMSDFDPDDDEVSHLYTVIPRLTGIVPC